jgi:hypothetical protein
LIKRFIYLYLYIYILILSFIDLERGDEILPQGIIYHPEARGKISSNSPGGRAIFNKYKTFSVLIYSYINILILIKHF